MEINISDLEIIRKIIERASKNGLFEATELVAVGSVYEKVKAIVDSATTTVPNGEDNG